MRNDVRLLPGVPDVESPFYDQIFDQKILDPGTKAIAHDLRERGYAIFDFPDDCFDERAERIKSDLKEQFDWNSWREGKVFGLRVQDAWSYNNDVKALAINEHVINLLSDLYGRKAFPFQTLNFPVGTQQHFHTDSVHFSSMPERFMCGVWTALEDIGPDQGGLVYYPGSHKLPIYTNEHIGNLHLDGKRTDQSTFEPMWRALVETYGLNPEVPVLKKGQALIWAANLLHGGSKQKNKSLTRWSQVTHYYFRDCAYYTPMFSDDPLGSIFFREPFDIADQKVVKNRYNGVEIPEDRIKSNSLSEAMASLVLAEFPRFNADAYLEINTDVAAANVDPFLHYWTYGRHENRQYSLD